MKMTCGNIWCKNNRYNESDARYTECRYESDEISIGDDGKCTSERK